MRVYILAISAIIWSNLSAQNMIQMNEKLKVRNVLLGNILNEGDRSHIWDMKNSSVSDQDFSIVYFANRDTSIHCNIVKLNNKTQEYLFQDHDYVKLVGFQNHTTTILYDIPEILYTFPIEKTEVSGFFSGRGETGNNILFTICGRYHTSAVQGVLITFEEDTLRQTTLLHTKRMFSSHQVKSLKADDTIDSLKSIPIDSIATNMDRDTSIYQCEEFQWYSRGYRYPILTSKIIKDRYGNEITASSYYLSPSLQVNTQNTENESPKNEEDSKKESMSPHADQTFINKDDLRVVLGHNQLQIDYSIKSDQNVATSFGLFSLDGRTIIEKDKGFMAPGFYHDSMHIPHIMAGVYIFTLRMNNYTFSQRITLD